MSAGNLEKGGEKRLAEWRLHGNGIGLRCMGSSHGRLTDTIRRVSAHVSMAEKLSLTSNPPGAPCMPECWADAADEETLGGGPPTPRCCCCCCWDGVGPAPVLMLLALREGRPLG